MICYPRRNGSNLMGTYSLGFLGAAITPVCDPLKHKVAPTTAAKVVKNLIVGKGFVNVSFIIVRVLVVLLICPSESNPGRRDLPIII